MKKTIIYILASLIILLFGINSYSTFVYAEDSTLANINLSKSEIINNDYFGVGDTVTINGTINGDAYVAGGNVTFDGIVNGDLLIAGGNVTILGKVTGDVRAAGGNVIFSSQVDKNVTLVGGSISMSDSGNVLGSLVSAGGNVSIYTPIGKGANIAGGQITLGNAVGNDVNVYTSNLSIVPSAKIVGDLNYWSENELQLSSEASISGTTTYHYVEPSKYESKKPVEKIESEKILGIMTAGSLMFGLYVLMIQLLIGLLVIKLTPVFMKETTEVISSRPLASLGMGFLIVLLLPIVFILLLISIIGIPLAFALIVGMILYWIVSGIAIALFVGLKAQHYFGKQKTSLYWSYLIGLIIMTLIGLIPVINFLVGMISFFIGTGALLLQKKQLYSSLRQKEII
jgi:hypothetical protein